MSSNGEKKNPRQPNLGVFLSALVIGLSFIAMVIPLAIYHLAQVAAAIRLRTALGILFSVVGFLLFLGILTSDKVFLSSGIYALFWAPILGLVLYFRAKLKSCFLSGLLLCAPAIFVLISIFILPQISNFDQFLDNTKATLIQGLTGEKLQQTLNVWESSISQFKNDFLTYSKTTEFFSFSIAERLRWLVFGDGSSLFGTLLLVGMTSLILLDFAFEQIEKYKAIAFFVLKNFRKFDVGFSAELLPLILKKNNDSSKILANFKESYNSDKSLSHLSTFLNALTNLIEYPKIQVTGFRKTELSSTIKNTLILPTKKSNDVLLGGFLFELDIPKYFWNLRRMQMPFWLVFSSIVFLIINLYLHKNGFFNIQNSQAIVLGFLVIIALFILCILSVQGMLVAFERLTPLSLLIVSILLLSIWFMLSLNIYVLLSFFGIVGLLDYAYNLRNT